jgi:glycosyltransferase involved in cell wall biosynthesis
MKIIFYSPHPTHDIVTENGYATHQRETIIALEKLGVEVIPVVMGGTTLAEVPYKGGKAIEHKGLKAKIKKIIPRFIWVSIKDFLLMQFDKKAGKKLEATVLKHKPNIIYERSEYLQDSGVKPAKIHGVKYFVEVNAPFVQEMKSLEGWSFWLWLGHRKERNKYSAADKIFVNSTALKDFLIKRYNVNSDKILVSPNRINKEEFIEGSKMQPTVIPQFNDESLPIIGFVGSILPHHYVDVLVDAFSIINKNNIKANLLIVGGGSLVDILQLKVNNLGISNCVFLSGKVPHKNVPALINMMDICVMPGSDWYGSPIKIFEYGILGKAVIAPNNGPVKDVMVHRNDGLLLERDPIQIADALTELIENKELRLKLGENFRNKIIAEYTWDKAAEMILNSYHEYNEI